MPIPTAERPLSLSALCLRAQSFLETEFPSVWVEAEIAELSQPRSGHWYLRLKDEGAQLDCVMFKGHTRTVGFRPQPGQLVVLHGRLSLYERQGRFQLLANQMRLAGRGELLLRVEQLRRRLQAEGLFDDSRKRPVPRRARHIAVVTSPSGAALHDVLSVLKRRFPSTAISIVPSVVQGNQAPQQLVAAIARANALCATDGWLAPELVLICRGGGDAEDLQAFNDERVARAIANSRLPVVSAVGHEVDFSIADFTADLRAPTPSAAAELLSADQEELRRQLGALRVQLTSRTQRHLQTAHQWLDGLWRRLGDPQRTLDTKRQQLDNLERRLGDDQVQRLEALKPSVEALDRQLEKALQRQLERTTALLSRRLTQLEWVGPLATLRRGYAIVQDAHSGRVLHSATQTAPGRQLQARLGEGALLCRVEEQQP